MVVSFAAARVMELMARTEPQLVDKIDRAAAATAAKKPDHHTTAETNGGAAAYTTATNGGGDTTNRRDRVALHSSQCLHSK